MARQVSNLSDLTETWGNAGIYPNGVSVQKFANKSINTYLAERGFNRTVCKSFSCGVENYPRRLNSLKKFKMSESDFSSMPGNEKNYQEQKERL